MIATIDDEPIPIAGDWHGFSEWGRMSERRQLRHLAEFRWCQDLTTLASELDDAILRTHPADDVAAVAERLLAELEQRGGAEVLAIEDGPECAVVETFREQRDYGDGLEWVLEV